MLVIIMQSNEDRLHQVVFALITNTVIRTVILRKIWDEDLCPKIEIENNGI